MNKVNCKSFLIFDDKCENYYVARRKEDEIEQKFRDMVVGEVRMLTETIGIEREQ
tara:strand:+ start:263 stop:427 length:165 start_codon:yes stop_codon:yes gene_type:complete